MKMQYRPIKLLDPISKTLVICRLGLDCFAVPRRHRIALARLGEQARTNREAERRACVEYNRRRHRVTWPPPLRSGSKAALSIQPPPAPPRPPAR